MFVALQTSDMFVMENTEQFWEAKPHTGIFLHSLQHPCFPANIQICTDPKNLTLSTGIRQGPGLLDLSGTFPSKVCTISLRN